MSGQGKAAEDWCQEYIYAFPSEERTLVGRGGPAPGLDVAGPGSTLTTRTLVHQVHARFLPRPPPAVGRVQETLVVVGQAVGTTHRLILLLAVLAAAAAPVVER